MAFRSREQAAGLLARRLAKYQGASPLILGIPRGAVPMARILADALGGEMDVVLVRKLRMPGHPELAIGAVDEAGHVYRGEYASEFGVSDDALAREIRLQKETLTGRQARYRAVHPAIDAAGRIAIVVDDGLATGATMISALRAIRAAKPRKLIAATPVASRGALRAIEGTADEVVCLETPAEFHAVGEFYDRFPQVSDDEVVAVLRRGPHPPIASPIAAP